MVSYYPDITYIVYSTNIGDTIVDYNGNIYTLDTSFPKYTYYNSLTNLSPNFGYPFIPNLNPNPNPNLPNMTNVVLGTNCNTKLPELAFSDCNNLNSLIIPDSVVSIGNGAFMGCNLNSLIIPDSVVSIGNSAFYANLYLTTITVGKGVVFIDEVAFNYLGGYTTPTAKTPTLHWGSNDYVANYFYSNFNTFVNYDPPYPPTTTLGATCTMTSSGVDPDTGTVVTASSSASATASGDELKDALKALLEDVTLKSLLEAALKFSSNYEKATHTFSITLDR